VTTTFEVLAEPNRRRILDLLLEEERPVGDLVLAMQASQPSVSKHLRVLRDAGLVESRTEAQRRVYRVCAGPLHDVDEWLVPYRRLWASSLEALSGYLDTMDDTEEAPRD
jgi:DNA-binding transcriptional ArsR family regulator